MAETSRPRSPRWRRFVRRTPPGAMPGTIIADPTKPPPRLRVICFGPETSEEVEIKSLDEIPPIRARNRVLWLNVDGLGDSDVITRIGEMFHLHRLALEDVV